jgi:excisionase family DNA binding protein
MRLFSVSEVAELTGLSESVLYRAIADGELRASKLRGRLRVRLVDLEVWIESNLVRPDIPRRIRRTQPRPQQLSQGRGLRELLREP